MVTGSPGAGKSTVAPLVADQFERSALVDGDTFFAFLCAGAFDPWLVGAHAQNEVVTDAAAAATSAFVAGGYDTVYDGVVGPWFLPAFARRLSVTEHDYVVLLPPVEVCVARVASRVGHGFCDEAAARSMHEQFVAHRPADRHVIDDGSLSAAAIADMIVDRRRRGLLHLRREDLRS